MGVFLWMLWLQEETTINEKGTRNNARGSSLPALDVDGGSSDDRGLGNLSMQYIASLWW